MRFRVGLTMGFAAGYVLGARAGRARYDQIVKAARRFRKTESVQNLTDRSRAVLGGGMTVASEKIRRIAERPAAGL